MGWRFLFFLCGVFGLFGRRKFLKVWMGVGFSKTEGLENLKAMCQGCKKAKGFGFRGIKINHTQMSYCARRIRSVSGRLLCVSIVCNMVLVYEAIYFQYVYKNPVSLYAYSIGSGKWNTFICRTYGWVCIHVIPEEFYVKGWISFPL